MNENSNINAESNRERAMRLARGSYQRALLKGIETVGGSTLRGKAKEYASRYRDSARNLLSRLDAAGVRYRIRRGPRGGWLVAVIVLDD